jgi:glycosyltransferase involved in cell wall biosynthesis
LIPVENKPLISIVLSTYNGERYLREQMETVVNQTYSPLEIIVVDDKSTDSTPEIIREYASRFPIIKAYFNEENLGYVKNFEKGARLSGGDFISFCDQDDVWTLNKTEILIEAIGSKPLVFCDDLMVDQDLKSLGKRQSDLVNSMSVDNPLYFVLDNVVGGHALLMTRTQLERALPFPSLIPHDLWCAYTSCFYGGVKYLDQVLVSWRQHTHAVTKMKKAREKRIQETRARLKFFYDYCPPSFPEEKKVMAQLIQSYQNFSFGNNFLRMYLFFRYQDYLLGFKKRNSFRKFLFCLKMFFKVRLHVA